MKKLIFAGAIFSLTTVSLVPAVRANGVDCGTKVLHLGDSSATPNYGRPNTTHDFEVHVVKSHNLSIRDSLRKDVFCQSLNRMKYI